MRIKLRVVSSPRQTPNPTTFGWNKDSTIQELKQEKSSHSLLLYVLFFIVLILNKKSRDLYIVICCVLWVRLSLLFIYETELIEHRREIQKSLNWRFLFTLPTLLLYSRRDRVKQWMRHIEYECVNQLYWLFDIMIIIIIVGCLLLWIGVVLVTFKKKFPLIKIFHCQNTRIKTVSVSDFYLL